MKKLPSIALIHGWATEPAIWESVRRQLDSQGYKVTVYECQVTVRGLAKMEM